MPVANYQPLAGKFGCIKFGPSSPTAANLSEHELRATGDDIDTSHFESDVSGDGLIVYGEGLVGLTEADIMTRGMYDGKHNPHETPFFCWPGYFGTVFLGLTKNYGYSTGFRCLQSPVNARVRGGVGFEGRLKSNGLITKPVGSVS